MKRTELARKVPIKQGKPIARTAMKRTSMVPRVPSLEQKPAKGPKQKRCANRACRAPCLPDARVPFKDWCSDDCAVVLGLERAAKRKAKEQRADRAETKKKLEQHKPLEYWLKKTEVACNAYIRARDPNICISCGVTDSSAWQAGHYISVGANGTLRFNEDNIHKQCIHCNMHKASNALEYRPRLIAKIGLERVEWLESWHSPVKMTREAAQELEAYYKAKLRALKASR